MKFAKIKFSSLLFEIRVFVENQEKIITEVIKKIINKMAISFFIFKTVKSGELIKLP